MKVTITLEDGKDELSLNCEFSEAVTDETRSTAVFMAMRMVEYAKTILRARWN
jgi:hypothetical protein